ncbi:hypothetical protein WL61_23240 [Burkholderia ubonensis]|nr:hypothetical protein WK14_07145 [Burkholderia ubonensis]KWD17057.1 hypothetical protein WL61_23240 [Burkholderia ubonensis]KWD23638.1 hypothetical protein WL62_14105 [Burkholderia ubonensis]
MKMAFERSVVVELTRPVFVDGEMMEAGDLVEMPASEARAMKVRKQARDPQERAGKGAAKGRGA